MTRDDNHVGIDVNSLTSVVSYKAGYWSGNKKRTNWSFEEIRLNENMKKKPQKPLINVPLDLSDVLLDEMYVGFTASTGQLVQNPKIQSWSFNNSMSQ